VGITSGQKYTGKTATEDDFSIRFLVRKKLGPRSRGRKLPKFVYARTATGKLDRQLRFSTDVVALGRVKAACGAGTFLQCVPGGRGTATLIFKDKGDPSAGSFVVSCAHVLSRLGGGKKVIKSECCDVPVFASLVFASRPANGRLKFDIAIAQLTDECLPQPDLKIVRDLSLPSSKVVGFAPHGIIAPKIPVLCRMRVSHNTKGVVADHPDGGEVDIEYDNGMVLTVENVCLLEVNRPVLGGDSGSLIFTRDNLALGVVIANSETGWAIFHPFSSAFQHIAEKTKQNYQPF
jgi:hypothetical protein